MTTNRPALANGLGQPWYARAGTSRGWVVGASRDGVRLRDLAGHGVQVTRRSVCPDPLNPAMLPAGVSGQALARISTTRSTRVAGMTPPKTLAALVMRSRATDARVGAEGM